MNTSVALALACTAALAEPAVPPAKPAPRVPSSITFDSEAPGCLPEGWKIVASAPETSIAAWAVTPDPAAPSAPNVLRLTTPDNDPSEFNLCIYEPASIADVDLTVKMRADAGKEDQGGGLIWRVRDDRNYYLCRFNPLEDNFRVYKVVGGKRRQLESADAKGASDGHAHWYTVRARMIGPDITCWLDGQELLHAHDVAFTGPGKVGLWSKADASSSFDDFGASAVRSIPERSHTPPPAPAK